MSETMNFFDLLGVDMKPMEEKSVKKVVKKETKKAKKSASKASPKLYKLPITVYTGFDNPFILTESDFDAAEVEQKVLGVKIAEKCGYTDKMITLDIKDSKCWVTFQRAYLITKGNLKLTTETVMRCGSQLFDLSSVMTDETCEVDVSDLQKLVIQTLPYLGEAKNIGFYHDGNVIVPRFDLPMLHQPKEFPVTVKVPGRADICITEIAYTAFRNTLTSSAETQDTDKETDSGTEDTDSTKESKIQKSVLEKYIVSVYPDFEGHLDLRYHKKTNVMIAVLKGVADVQPAAKTKLISTDGTTISLLFTKIVLHPDMFDGEDEVEEAEIIRFLAKDYPEFSKDRTEIVYDAKKKLIMPILKGSRKGAEFVTDSQREVDLLARPYALYEKELKGIRFRVENTPIAYFSTATDGNQVGAVHYKLPLIPYEIFAAAKRFFSYVTNTNDTEAMLQIFWDNDEKEYFLYCPKQYVSHAYLDCERNDELEREAWLIMDIHSHGRIGCSFSLTDDEDEKGTRFYGVYYGFHENGDCTFDLRMGCGGHFHPMQMQELFESEKPVDLSDADYTDWLKSVQFV